MKHKKYKFFLADVPLMLFVGVLVIMLADNYDGKATMVGYQVESQELGEYTGDVIRDGGTTGALNQQEKDFYNGSDIRDNGMPYSIKVNKTQNVVTIYKVGDDGCYSVPVKAMICSVGETGNTPEGVFELGAREEWLALENDVYGQYATVITGSFLFHSVPYFTQDKSDLEIEEYNKLGKSVSAGCVRLSVIDAKWIYDNCGEGTLVEIFESDYEGPLGKPVAAVISSGGSVGNWDPTDPDRENPYMANIPMILGAYDREVERYSHFDVTSGVVALDSQGNEVTGSMQVEGEVDWDTCGIYKITYSVTDETGITGAATANIIVKDEQPPVIYAEQKVHSIGVYDVTSVDELCEMLLQNVVAYDGNQQLPHDSIIVDYSEIMNKGYGKCHVKYRAKDTEGNESDVVVLTIDVDMEAPIIKLSNEQQGEIRVSNMKNDDYLLSLVEATDNSGRVDVTVSRPLTYTSGEPYIVMYCAKDDFGNVSTLSVTYYIKE
ncbi:MAG: L,D-transpeptidase family protein [Lachnospiraceae bacterium]|nr:L,D-transpeptidase family protein [Lachnospiraceae bacterium]